MKWVIVLTLLWLNAPGGMQPFVYEKEVVGITKAECEKEADKVMDSLIDSLDPEVYGLARVKCTTTRPINHTSY